MKLKPEIKIRVAILDDHQGIIDGYVFRLEQAPDIEVVATTAYGGMMDSILAQHHPDVVILDVFVPTSAEDASYFPVLQTLPRWLRTYSDLSILVISAYNLRTLVNATIRSGASGYLLKDDHESIQRLADIVRSVARGGKFFSKKVDELILPSNS